MARIPYYDPAKASPKLAEMMGKLKPSLNIYRMLANADGAARGFVHLGNSLLFRGKLDPKLRELAILRVGWLSRASYEVYQHERIGRDVGLSDAKIRGVQKGADDPAFDATERAVIRFTEDVVKNVKASDATFREVSARFAPDALVELVLTIGYYMMVSRFLETMGVDDEAGQAEWRDKYWG